MIVCMCSNVNEIEIEELIDNGLDTLDKFIENSDIGTGCGTCQAHVLEILKRRVDKVTK